MDSYTMGSWLRRHLGSCFVMSSRLLSKWFRRHVGFLLRDEFSPLEQMAPSSRGIRAS